MSGLGFKELSRVNLIFNSGMNIERLLLPLSQKDLETTYIYDDHLIIEAWETL